MWRDIFLRFLPLLCLFFIAFDVYAKNDLLYESIDEVFRLWMKKLKIEFKTIKEPPTEQEKKVANATGKMSGKIGKVLVTSLHFSSNLDEKYREYFRAQLRNMGYQEIAFHFSICKECLLPKIEISDDKMDYVVKKGVMDKKELEEMGKKLEVSYYGEISIVYSGTHLTFLSNIFEIKNRTLVKSYSYQIRAKDSANGSKLIYSLGIGMENGIGASGTPIGVHLVVGEELRKRFMTGVDLHYSTESNYYKQIFAIGPYFDLNLNDLFDFYWNSGELYWNARIGYGVYGNSMNIMVGTGLKFFMANYFFLYQETLAGMAISLGSKGEETAAPVAIGFGSGLIF